MQRLASFVLVILVSFVPTSALALDLLEFDLENTTVGDNPAASSAATGYVTGGVIGSTKPEGGTAGAGDQFFASSAMFGSNNGGYFIYVSFTVTKNVTIDRLGLEASENDPSAQLDFDVLLSPVNDPGPQPNDLAVSLAGYTNIGGFSAPSVATPTSASLTETVLTPGTYHLAFPLSNPAQQITGTSQLWLDDIVLRGPGLLEFDLENTTSGDNPAASSATSPLIGSGLLGCTKPEGGTTGSPGDQFFASSAMFGSNNGGFFVFMTLTVTTPIEITQLDLRAGENDPSLQVDFDVLLSPHNAPAPAANDLVSSLVGYSSLGSFTASGGTPLSATTAALSENLLFPGTYHLAFPLSNPAQQISGTSQLFVDDIVVLGEVVEVSVTSPMLVLLLSSFLALAGIGFVSRKQLSDRI